MIKNHFYITHRGQSLDKRTLTTGEIAQNCGVNFRTVIRWIKRGHLRAFQLPGRGDNRVTSDDFLAFLEQHKMPIPEEFRKHTRRVLIVDDDMAMASNIQRILRRAGFETEIAQDGFQAGVLFESFAPNVMTLDLMMPGLGGLEVIRFVRKTNPLQNIKILVVSGLSGANLANAIEAGADSVLEKPFENEDLIEKVSELVGVKK